MGQKIGITDAATEHGVCSKTIRRYIAIGLLPAYRVGPKLIRVDTDDLAALLTPMPSEVA
jgi:excisionase family DNA binding protein